MSFLLLFYEFRDFEYDFSKETHDDTWNFVYTYMYFFQFQLLLLNNKWKDKYIQSQQHIVHRSQSKHRAGIPSYFRNNNVKQSYRQLQTN